MFRHTWTHRLWLALAYLLATGFAQCAHRHSPVEEGSATRCLASCDDQRVHLSGHTSVDLGQHRDHCLACQFRTSHLAGRDLGPALFGVACTGRFEVQRQPLTVRHVTSGHSCRAPPHA